jgi:hypothetical protein
LRQRRISGLHWLISSQNSVFRRFGCTAFDYFIDFDLNGFARGGVADQTGFALYQDQFAKPWQCECVLCILECQRSNMLEHFKEKFKGLLLGSALI